MTHDADGRRPTPTGPVLRDPVASLQGCNRVLVLGRTGSGKTTLARQLAEVLGVQHVELDALYFDADLSTAPLHVLRARTSAAVAGDQWVTDGNKRAVRDIVWPRADTVVWLDYPLIVSLWRLGKRAARRTSAVGRSAARGGPVPAAAGHHLLVAGRGVLRALRSHRGQRRLFPAMLAEPSNRHLAVVRLRSPRQTRTWLARISQE